MLHYDDNVIRTIDYDSTRIKTIRNVETISSKYKLIETVYDYATQQPAELRMLISSDFLHAIINQSIDDGSMLKAYAKFSQLIYDEAGAYSDESIITNDAQKLLTELKEKLHQFHNKKEPKHENPMDNIQDEFKKPYGDNYGTPYEELLSKYLGTSVMGTHPAIMLLHELLNKVNVKYDYSK